MLSWRRTTNCYTMLTTEKDTRTCVECDSVLHGRSDQKFCSRHCRNAFNNRHNSGVDALMRKINRVLKRNRQILYRLNPTGKKKIRHQRLRNEGFNFSYYTSIYTTREGTQYYFCYDYGYLPIENDYVMLVRRQPYMP